jgi:hypothetical protein
MSYSGKFTPKNPNKYVGDPNNIVYRSSWECRCMSYFDRTDEIISWASEELVIPYRSPVDGKIHRYFPDFLIRVKNGDKTKTIMIEVKPYKQTQPPKQRSRVTKQYITEVTTWGVNQSKWKAAEEYCKDRNWEFKILTEIDLVIN